jgi:hypothetical protein
MQELLHEAMGIDSFALDGDEQDINQHWQERPHLCRTPQL